MVAKSFQQMEQVCDPYIAAGKWYVKVKHPKTGNLRQVRWYSEAEYRKLYPDEVVDHAEDKYFKTQKEIFGFDKGYITIFKGNTYEDKDYFKASQARYCKLWGWYFVSTIELPEDLPDDVQPVCLCWEFVGKDDGSLLPEDKVIAAVESLIYEPSESEFVGEIGDRVELWLTVDKAVALDGYYGTSTLHQMHDDAGNVYVWTTSSKSWTVGSEHHIKGTIKDHKVYHNEHQTYLTRCTEVK